MIAILLLFGFLVTLVIAYYLGKAKGMHRLSEVLDSSLRPTSFKEFQLRQLRSVLDNLFTPETASPGTTSKIPSAGHCAVVSLLIRSLFEGDLVSAKVAGVSHWYNCIREGLYVDLTGDQFGFPKIQISNNPIYPGTRKRDLAEVSTETHLRYSTLRDKYQAALNQKQAI